MTLRTWLSTSSMHSAARLARPVAATLLLGGLLLGFSVVDGTVQVAHAQKSGGSKPPPPVALPPARYKIQWLDGGLGMYALSPRDINKWGDLAGPASDSTDINGTAFAYDSSIGQALNLNSLGALWLDLNAAAPTEVTGWRATSAYGINDMGDVSGSAAKVNSNLTRAFVLVNALNRDPLRMREFLLLPSAGTASQYGRCINNHGEVIGASGSSLVRFRPTGTVWPYYTAAVQPGILTDFVMDLNDDGVVVSRYAGVGSTVSYRQLFPGVPPDTFNTFNGLEFWCISNGANPWISGYKASGGNGKTGVPSGPIRLPALGGVTQVQSLASYGVYARAVNDEGDTVFESGGRGYLYSDAINPTTGKRYGSPIVVNGVVVDYDGVLPLDRMVVNPNTDWADGIRLDGINGLGMICGRKPASPSRGFLLIPYLP
jgi:hypothetical protein